MITVVLSDPGWSFTGSTHFVELFLVHGGDHALSGFQSVECCHKQMWVLCEHCVVIDLVAKATDLLGNFSFAAKHLVNCISN